MKHIQTISTIKPKENEKHGNCGECPTSCQSRSKTSNPVAHQVCENQCRMQGENKK